MAPAVAMLSAGAGYVHIAYMESHWRDWWAYGAFFLAAGACQLLYGPLLLLLAGARTRRWTVNVLLVSGVALWGLRISQGFA